MKRRCLLLLLLLSALTGTAQAQFDYTIANGQVTITRYSGTGGAVTIPSTITGLPVSGIGQAAFADCAGLTSVTVPNSVSSIGQAAFVGCVSLTSVSLPNSVTTIERSMFEACTSLASVTIPNGVIVIESYAFSGCTSLMSVSIPNGVFIIKDDVFSGCTNLTSVTIPKSVVNLGSSAFDRCASLTAVCFKGNAPYDYYDVFNDRSWGGTKAVVYYLPGTVGWEKTTFRRLTKLWNPAAPTADAKFGVQAGQFGFNIKGTSGLVIVVEACTDLANNTWTSVKTLTLANGSGYFSDPDWAGHPSRFYRFRSP